VTGGVASLCDHCGTQLAPGLLSCPGCRRLVHAAELKRLAAAAEAAEQAGDIATAAERWQDALVLLPADAKQHAVIANRVAELGERMTAQPGRPHEKKPAWVKGAGVFGAAALLLWKFNIVLVFLLTKAKLLLLGLTKLGTLGSMLISFGVYWQIWGWQFAAGLLLSIYIHEMGHVAAMSHYGIKASAPMFIPGVGAFVRGRAYPGAPGVDARIGLAGPLWGLGAALLAWGLFALTGAPVLLAVAKFGAFINLFNLLPVWHLDGGWAFNALPQRDRWLAAAAVFAVWFASSESFLVLIGLAAVWRAFTAAAAKRDVGVLWMYAGLIAALALLARLPVPVPAEGQLLR
jgi:Zn-dependent protease